MDIPFRHTIQLDEMNQVKLMKRLDTKYWFHISKLPEVLEVIKNDYFILQINNKYIFPYFSRYYDTEENSMYLAHHNRRCKRYKIRHRVYLDSGLSFLEVKRKDNKGKTLKTRILSDFTHQNFEQPEQTFINSQSPYSSNGLLPTLQNMFDRITLVSKNFDERCTIDLNLQFITEGEIHKLHELAIIEVKTEGLPSNSTLATRLRDAGIRRSGFSKYCMGRVLTDPSIKSNAFKPNIRRIQKTIFQETIKNQIKQCS